jgi:enoyl-CoA hydratase
MAELIIEVAGALGRIRLNRPEALNALTHDMVHGIDAALTRFADDASVTTILLSGDGTRGLCAGGDIRGLWSAPRVADGPAMGFWRDEYRLNARIAGFEKPVVVFMDGLVMGGGMGISALARHRIVTERSRIAYPECGIGFVPDVGATWLLPRAPGQAGLWMGLTGRALAAADAIWMGLADSFMASTGLPQLIKELASGERPVADVLKGLSGNPGAPALAAEAALIDRVFAGNDVGLMLSRLAAEPGDFAAGSHADISAKSPSALFLAVELFVRGRQANCLKDALELEFAAARALVTGHDFYEGIRAAIIDKDRNPRWIPAQIADIPQGWAAKALALTGDRVFSEGSTT